MTPEEKAAIRKRMDDVYLECWQPFDSVPDDKWKAAYEDIESLLAEVERLEARLWSFVSPSSNIHDTSCSVPCDIRDHTPEGAPDDAAIAKRLRYIQLLNNTATLAEMAKPRPKA